MNCLLVEWGMMCFGAPVRSSPLILLPGVVNFNVRFIVMTFDNTVETVTVNRAPNVVCCMMQESGLRQSMNAGSRTWARWAGCTWGPGYWPLPMGCHGPTTQPQEQKLWVQSSTGPHTVAPCPRDHHKPERSQLCRDNGFVLHRPTDPKDTSHIDPYLWKHQRIMHAS